MQRDKSPIIGSSEGRWQSCPDCGQAPDHDNYYDCPESDLTPEEKEQARRSETAERLAGVDW